MIDYIKRSDAIKAVYEEWDEWIYYDGSGREIASDTEDALCRLDAEDVAPVRHGKWIYHMDDLYPEESTMECSVCGDFIFIRGESDNYCPNCGAKMDGEDDA